MHYNAILFVLLSLRISNHILSISLSIYQFLIWIIFLDVILVFGRISSEVLYSLEIKWVFFICLDLLESLLTDSFEQENLTSRILDKIWRSCVDRIVTRLVLTTCSALLLLKILLRLAERTLLLLLIWLLHLIVNKLFLIKCASEIENHVVKWYGKVHVQ